MQAARFGGRLYLVVDPAPGADVVLPKVEAALRGGVDVLQVWNHWARGQHAPGFLEETVALARPRQVPVLVHERIDLLETGSGDGIHYDTPVLTPAEVRDAVGRDVLYGVTCSNDLGCLHRAVRDGADYVSFCSMYPSASAGDCEIVSLDTLRQARRLGGFTIFASGGITPGNAARVLAAGSDGIAVISGILGADDPERVAREYTDAIRRHDSGSSDA